MKEYTGNAANYSLVEQDDGTFLAFCEVIILTSEPVFTIDMTGQLVRQRSMEHFRFGATLKAMRGLIGQLQSYAEDMEKAEARVVSKPIAEAAQ